MNTEGDYVFAKGRKGRRVIPAHLVFVNTCQHKSTLVNGYWQNAASIWERAWIWVENRVMLLAGKVDRKNVFARHKINYAEMSHIHDE